VYKVGQKVSPIINAITSVHVPKITKAAVGSRQSYCNNDPVDPAYFWPTLYDVVHVMQCKNGKAPESKKLNQRCGIVARL